MDTGRTPPRFESMIDFFARSRPVYWLTSLLTRRAIAAHVEEPLAPLTQEQIATFVSRLNHCSYCARSHACDVEVLGGDLAAIDAAVTDLDAAPLDDRLRALFRFVRALVREPDTFGPADWERALVAGWSAAELEAAVYVTAQFQFMNTIATGNLIPATPLEVARDLAARRQGPEGYGVVVREVEQRSGVRVRVNVEVTAAAGAGSG